MQWSQDGSEVAYFRHDDFGNPVIEIYSIESNSSVKIRLDSGKNAIKQTPIYELNWSPDKRFFAFIVARYPNAGSFGGKVWLLRVVDGQLISITDYRSLSTCPQFSQDSRFLFFTANSDIYRQQINPDGTPEGVPELLITSAKARHAHFSLDGKRVAFISQGINPNVWRVRIPLLSEKPAMKSEIKQVTYLDQYLRDFTISPDRATIYFTATLPGSRSYQLWKMQISGNKLQKLSDDSFNYFHPSISPDGETLVYSRTKSTDNYNGSLWTMSLKDGKEHFVYGTASDEQSPQWSPDGNEIVFVKNDDIYTVSIDNRELRRITINGYKNNYARWSPKGRQIAFQSRKDDTTSVWVVSADGGDAKRITSGLDSRPCWSTNGKQLYFIRQTVNQSNIWEVSLENGRERQITDIIDQLRFFPSFLIAHDNSLFFSLLQVTSNITTREVVYQ
ncbi:MAG: TolB family protein [bacterium]